MVVHPYSTVKFYFFYYFLFLLGSGQIIKRLFYLCVEIADFCVTREDPLVSYSAPGRPVCGFRPCFRAEGAGDYNLVQVTMSTRGEEAGEPSGSQEQPATAQTPKRGPGRPRKPQQVSIFFPSNLYNLIKICYCHLVTSCILVILVAGSLRRNRG